MFVNHSKHHSYRYGATFIDSDTGLRVIGTHPDQRRDLWRAYLDGAQARYAFHGVEGALGRRQVERSGCSLFWTIIDTDANVLGGLRVHGPLARAADASALIEMTGSFQLGEISAILHDRIRAGLVELKGTWSAVGLERHQADSVARLLGRCTVHSLVWFNVAWGLCTAHAASTGLFSAAGARAIPGIAPMPYPDDRFATLPMLWERRSLRDAADQDLLLRVDEESFQLRVTSSLPVRRRVSQRADRTATGFTRA